MKAERVVAAESVITLAGVIAADLQQQGDDKTLPRPRRILGWFGFYSVLSVVAALGTGPARIATAVGGVVTLLVFVQGAAGQDIIGLLGKIAGLFSAQGGTSKTSAISETMPATVSLPWGGDAGKGTNA